MEILPQGLTREKQERIERNQARIRSEGKGCLFFVFLIILALVYAAGRVS